MSHKPRSKRRKLRFSRRKPPGAPPETIHVDPAAAPPQMSLLAYDAERFESRRLERPDEALEFLGRWPVTWVNVESLGDAAVIKQLGEVFKLHGLALEDVVSLHQRAKVEQYSGHLYIVARMPRSGERIDTEQVSLFLGRDFVLTFLEDPGDCFDAVRERLRHHRGRLRESGADYLAYSLLDAVTDAYFPVLESYGERLDRLEEQVLDRRRNIFAAIHEIKTDLLVLRRAIWPHREAFNALVRDPCALVSAETRVYFRDCYDHTVQMIDLVEMYRELGSDLRDLYLTSTSNRMNEIMKVLTVITTVFMPLTFIAGVYGMNFDSKASRWNMPELQWKYGYPFALSLMAVATAGMLLAFWRRGWLGAPKVLPNGSVPEDAAANDDAANGGERKA